MNWPWSSAPNLTAPAGGSRLPPVSPRYREQECLSMPDLPETADTLRVHAWHEVEWYHAENRNPEVLGPRLYQR